MARFAQESGQVASNFDHKPEGIVRIATPPGTALELLVPFARDLRRSLPEIQLHTISAVEYLDLSRGHGDLAIRAKAPTQPDLMVVGHARAPLGVFASKTYAEQLQKKCRTGIADPSEMDWICWAYPNEHIEPNPTLKRLIPGFFPAFAANDYNVQMRAVAEGLGAMISTKTQHPDQPYPPFVEIPLALPLPPADLYLVCAKTMRWVPRVRAVITELIARLHSVTGLELLDAP
jgi:DNA-binding transcriptional LysR family regulator